MICFKRDRENLIEKAIPLWRPGGTHLEQILHKTNERMHLTLVNCCHIMVLSWLTEDIFRFSM